VKGAEGLALLPLGRRQRLSDATRSLVDLQTSDDYVGKPTHCSSSSSQSNRIAGYLSGYDNAT
jgi:hypothetical protein